MNNNEQMPILLDIDDGQTSVDQNEKFAKQYDENNSSQ